MHSKRSLLTGLILAVLTYCLSLWLGAALGNIVGRPEASSSWLQPALLRAFGSYTALGLFSWLLIAWTGGGEWRRFGFQNTGQPWGRFALLAVLLGVGVTLALKLSSRPGLDAALKGLAPLPVLLVVLYSTLVEELFTRGWLQGFLEPGRDRSVLLPALSLSVPVLASTLVFTAMHLTLVGKGVDPWSLVIILAFTAGAGLLSALARERTGSLLPAIWTHLAGNLGGVVGGLAYALLYRVQHGYLPTL